MKTNSIEKKIEILNEKLENCKVKIFLHWDKVNKNLYYIRVNSIVPVYFPVFNSKGSKLVLRDKYGRKFRINVENPIKSAIKLLYFSINGYRAESALIKDYLSKMNNKEFNVKIFLKNFEKFLEKKLGNVEYNIKNVSVFSLTFTNTLVIRFFVDDSEIIFKYNLSTSRLTVDTSNVASDLKVKINLFIDLFIEFFKLYEQYIHKFEFIKI